MHRVTSDQLQKKVLFLEKGIVPIINFSAPATRYWGRGTQVRLGEIEWESESGTTKK